MIRFESPLKTAPPSAATHKVERGRRNVPRRAAHLVRCDASHACGSSRVRVEPSQSLKTSGL
jgi:hypothetical protein